MGRTHGIHAEPTTFGLKLAGLGVRARARPRAGAARARRHARREAVRRGRDVRARRSAGRARRLRAARPRAGADVDAGHPARPPCGAALCAGARRGLARDVRARDPPPRPDRGRRGGRAVRPQAEGLVGDAAQAQSGRGRAHLRARAGRPRTGDRRPRERRALARARHLALVRRARGHPGRVPRARLHARPLRVARRRAWSSGPSGCAGTSRRASGCTPASACCSRSSSPGSRATTPTVSSSATRCARGTRSGRFRELVAADAEIAAPRRPRRGLRRRRIHAPRRHRLRAPRRARHDPQGGPPCLKRSHVGSGKVRELYALDDERLLLTASDRISTFDVVLPTEIPDKGRVLTGLSGFWFARTRDIVAEPSARDPAPTAARLECRRLEMLPIECVVRGYLSGSGWKDYKATGAVCGHRLPEGLPESDGCRSRSSRRRRRRRAATTRTSRASRRRSWSAPSASPRRSAISLALYALRRRLRGAARDHARRHEVRARNRRRAGALVLGDEAMTPDSSRFWPADEYAAGGPQPSFDKQFVRDYCETLGWDKTDPGPELPGRRRRRHARALRRGVRAADGDPVRRLRRRPGRGAPVRATVLVRPKPGILDPQGEAVESSLRHLGFSVGGARVGRLVELEVDAPDAERARAELERMCEQLLTNPLIESYEIELRGEREDARRRRHLPRLERRPRRTAGARAARRRAGRGVARGGAAARGRRRCAPGRLLVRRLPALRRDRALLARDAGRARVRRGGRAGARDLQRLPGALRGRAAPRRTAPERVARVRMHRRRCPRRAGRHAVHLRELERRCAHDPHQARRGRLVRRRRAARRGRGRRPGGAPLREREPERLGGRRGRRGQQAAERHGPHAHPEHAVDPLLGPTGGLPILESLVAAATARTPILA